MNIESVQPKNTKPVIQSSSDDSMFDDFEFKPITSGLGFHQPKANEIKPITPEKITQPAATQMISPIKAEASNTVYQNDLSIFYGVQTTTQKSQTEIEEISIKQGQVEYRNATRSERILAYLVDVFFIVGVVGITLTIMARTISMDLLQVWSLYPSEITPLVITIFCGFYMIYFSIFEKTSQSTLGKNILGIKIISLDNKQQSFSTLLLRTLISLSNFASLGLFSYFDLQNKITSSKVVKVN